VAFVELDEGVGHVRLHVRGGRVVARGKQQVGFFTLPKRSFFSMTPRMGGPFPKPSLGGGVNHGWVVADVAPLIEPLARRR
jgi:hypothetical protein